MIFEMSAMGTDKNRQVNLT